MNAEVVVAEALAEAFGEASHGDLATKADLAAARTEIGGIKLELLKWIIGAIGFQTVAILGALVSPIRIVA